MRYQTTHLRNSVVQARKAAKVAKISADALIASQRAWLDAEFKQKIFTVYDLIATNHGPTPAQFLTLEILFHREGQEFWWDSYDSRTTLNFGTLIGGGCSTDSLHQIPVREIFPEQESYFVALAMIYLDVLNPKIQHRTRCVFVYTARAQRLDRLSQYNEYT